MGRIFRGPFFLWASLRSFRPKNPTQKFLHPTACLTATAAAGMLTSRFPFLVLLDAFSNTERSDLANQWQRQRLLQRKLDETFGRDEFCKILREGAHRRRRRIKTDVIFERRERHQYPLVRKRGHSPLQAFRRPRRRFANTRLHFAQFLLRLLRCGADILSDVLRSRFFRHHDFFYCSRPYGSESFSYRNANRYLCHLRPSLRKARILASGLRVH